MASYKCFRCGKEITKSLLGKRIRWDGQKAERWATIIGVVPDIMTTGSLFEDPPEGIYVPIRQDPRPYLGVALRTQGNVLTISSSVREAVRAIDPSLPVYSLGRLSEIISNPA